MKVTRHARPEFAPCTCCDKKTVHLWDKYRDRYVCEVCGNINTSLEPVFNDRRKMVLDEDIKKN